MSHASKKSCDALFAHIFCWKFSEIVNLLPVIGQCINIVDWSIMYISQQALDSDKSTDASPVPQFVCHNMYRISFMLLVAVSNLFHLQLSGKSVVQHNIVKLKSSIQGKHYIRGVCLNTAYSSHHFELTQHFYVCSDIHTCQRIGNLMRQMVKCRLPIKLKGYNSKTP